MLQLRPYRGKVLHRYVLGNLIIRAKHCIGALTQLKPNQLRSSQKGTQPMRQPYFPHAFEKPTSSQNREWKFECYSQSAKHNSLSNQYQFFPRHRCARRFGRTRKTETEAIVSKTLLSSKGLGSTRSGQMNSRYYLMKIRLNQRSSSVVMASSTVGKQQPFRLIAKPKLDFCT